MGPGHIEVSAAARFDKRLFPIKAAVLVEAHNKYLHILVNYMKNRESMSAEDLRKESDWILFRERRPEWIGRYYTKLLAECAEDLYGPGTPSERFWNLEKHIHEKKRILWRLEELSRTTMHRVITDMLELNVITFADLEGFSDLFTECVKDALDMRKSIPD